ncbi:hypothetical protein M2266_000783 [Streptomyces sp. SPB162]|nr:hypothetical protein [Streptomyces sp. SPB162]
MDTTERHAAGRRAEDAGRTAVRSTATPCLIASSS